jgi:hypothetical protein
MRFKNQNAERELELELGHHLSFTAIATNLIVTAACSLGEEGGYLYSTCNTTAETAAFSSP